MHFWKFWNSPSKTRAIQSFQESPWWFIPTSVIYPPLYLSKYREILRISLDSVRMRENTDQKKLCIWTLFTQWELFWPRFVKPPGWFSHVNSTSTQLVLRIFWLLVLILLQHCFKLSRPYLVTVLSHWTWTKATPQKICFSGHIFTKLRLWWLLSRKCWSFDINKFTIYIICWHQNCNHVG